MHIECAAHILYIITTGMLIEGYVGEFHGPRCCRVDNDDMALCVRRRVAYHLLRGYIKIHSLDISSSQYDRWYPVQRSTSWDFL